MIFSRSQVKKAGKILKDKESFDPDKIIWAEDALTYWRTIHGKVIGDFHQIVSKLACEINQKSFVAQRLKRSPSIIAKLKRLHSIQLTTMQDIAGIRAVVKNMRELRQLQGKIKTAEIIHELVDEDDYVINPKDSGYRGVHLIYKFKDPEKSESDGLLIEIQIRTKLQHAWATSVETMSTFLGTHLKFNEGQPKWLKYFALTSSAFSFLEKSNPVPKYKDLSQEETFRQAIYEFNYNNIEDSLRAFTIAADIICKDKDGNNNYHLVVLDIEKKIVQITSFKTTEFELANQMYTQKERATANNDSVQVVLVSTESIHELRDAFPNYFLDTKDFLHNMTLIKLIHNRIKQNSA